VEKIDYVKTLNSIWDDIQKAKANNNSDSITPPQDTLPAMDFGEEWSLINTGCRSRDPDGVESSKASSPKP
jgi:hypothetical protein